MAVIDIQNKVVVILGGAGLLGRQFVRAVAEEGGIAVLADKDLKRAKEVYKGLPSGLKDKVMVHAVDLTSEKSLEKLCRDIHKSAGRVDALVNAAYPRNKNYGRPFDKVMYKDFCENISLHVGGYFLSCKVFGQYFKARKEGVIINLGSVYGVIPPKFEIYEGLPMTNTVEYAVIKSGIIHMTKYLAKYYKDHHVRVNCISPGGILDAQPEIFLKRYKSYCLSKGMLDRTDINGTVLFLLSSASKYINGQNIVIDDGFVL